MNRKLHDSIGVGVMLEAQSIAYTDTLTSLVDTKGFQALDILVAIGTLASVGTGESLLAVLQESDSTATGTFTDVAAADIVGAFTLVDAAAEDSVVQRVGYAGSKRYVRVNLNFTGSAVTGIVGVYAIAGSASSEPASNPTITAAT